MVKLVYTNGCFDILHAGHVGLLEQAARLGPLIVGVNSDASVRRLKGPTRPVNREADRLYVVRALRSVSVAHIFDAEDDSICDELRHWHPAVWVKGGDYTLDTLNPAEVAVARELGIEILILPAAQGYSTTNTLKALS